MKYKQFIVTMDVIIDGDQKTVRHIAEALDELVAVAKVAQRLTKKLPNSEIITASVKPA